ncbi:helix-turn-helix domain-containing protein [Mariniluteicoccus flavus]
MAGAVRPVHPALRESLAGPLVAYDLTLDPAAVHLGVPSASATMIIAFDEPIDVGWFGVGNSVLGDSGAGERHWLLASGLHLRPALVRTHGVQRGIQLALTPIGFRVLLGAPIGALAGVNASATDLPAGLRPDEHARLADLGSWAARLALLEHLLLQRVGAYAPGVPADIRRAWGLLVGGRTVADTAREVGWSRRHLGTRVGAEIGLTPKQVGRLGRFARARAMVRAGVGLAEAAYATGFADQSHLSREWSALAGQAPSRERDFPNLHDLDPAAR